MDISLEKDELKAVIKESISELFDQRRDYFVEIFSEVIEDKLFIDEIKAGESSGSVSRDEVFETLKNAG